MHDFGCRNYGRQGTTRLQLDPTDNRRKWIADRLLQKMKRLCNDGRLEIPCKTAAVTIHRAVRMGGERYFFSPPRYPPGGRSQGACPPATPPQEHRIRCSCRFAALGADQASFHGARREAGPQRTAAGVRRVGWLRGGVPAWGFRPV